MTEQNTSEQSSRSAPIVSSSHLAGSGMPELSEMEFALTIANNAFQRWIVRGLMAAGVADAGALDVLVLHVLYHRARPKRLADICLMLNLEDTHIVSYALKKLEKAGLVASTRKGKEKFAEVTPRGPGAVRALPGNSRTVPARLDGDPDGGRPGYQPAGRSSACAFRALRSGGAGGNIALAPVQPGEILCTVPCRQLLPGLFIHFALPSHSIGVLRPRQNIAKVLLGVVDDPLKIRRFRLVAELEDGQLQTATFLLVLLDAIPVEDRQNRLRVAVGKDHGDFFNNVVQCRGICHSGQKAAILGAASECPQTWAILPASM